MNGCTVCNLPNLQAINDEIAKGGSLREVARKFDLAYHLIYQHSLNHLPKDLSKEAFLKQQETLEDIKINKGRLEEMLQKAIEKGQTTTAIKVLTEVRAYNEQEARLNTSSMQIRIKELEKEIQQLRSGLTVEGEQEDIKLQVLTGPELKMLIRIQNKIFSQDKDDVIIAEGSNFKLTYGQIQQASTRVMYRLNGKKHPLLDVDEES